MFKTFQNNVSELVNTLINSIILILICILLSFVVYCISTIIRKIIVENNIKLGLKNSIYELYANIVITRILKNQLNQMLNKDNMELFKNTSIQKQKLKFKYFKFNFSRNTVIFNIKTTNAITIKFLNQETLLIIEKMIIRRYQTYSFSNFSESLSEYTLVGHKK